MLQIARFGAVAICVSSRESQITSALKGWGGTLVRPPPRGPPRKPLLRVSVLGLCLRSQCAVLCDDIRQLYGLTCMSHMISNMLSHLCQSACPSVCFAEEERAKCRTFFLLGYNVYLVFMLMLKRLRSVPLMGGLPCPSVSRSPEAAPQERAARPMGPSTPRCYPQSFLLSSCI